MDGFYKLNPAHVYGGVFFMIFTKALKKYY